MKAIDLRTEYLYDPIGLGEINPRLYWRCEGGLSQTCYEIKGTVDTKPFESAKVFSSSMTHIPFPVSVSSRSEVQWCVRLYDENAQAGPWSEPAHFEMGLLSPSDWSALWITSPEKRQKEDAMKLSLFRKIFSSSLPLKKARLYVTSFGIYEAQINGKKVGDCVLSPGSTDFRKRIHYQTYDVTSYIKAGENEIVISVAPGWLYSHKSQTDISYSFGDETKLLAQLEITDCNGKVETVVSDSTWSWCDDGPVLFADNKGGEVIDARRTPSFWTQVRIVSCALVPCASDNVLIKEHECFKPVLLTTPSGKKVLDFGQNIAGFVEFNLDASSGQKINLYMGEYLENGEFTQKNINPKMVGQKGSIEPFQKIEYTCHNGKNHYKTRFAIFGFQYVLVETDLSFSPEDFTAIAVYSDMEDILSFSSSNELLNRFVECTRWSGKNNSADVPTDCPQRERAGWTGDAQIFYKTATYFFDYASFGRKYIRDMMDAQWPDGSFTQMAPRPKMSFYMKLLDGSVGWSDAGVYIPYLMWKQYGDDRLISQYYDKMADYGKFMIKRCGKAPLFGKKPKISKKNRKYLVMKGMSYGEWIEPKELVPFSVSEIAHPHIEESTAYTSFTMGILEEIASYLGKESWLWLEYKEGCKNAYMELVALPEYSLDTNRQAKLVRPLYMNLLTGTKKAYAEKRLIEALDYFKWRVGTGFLSTPFILFVLEKIDPKYAFKLLENEDIPGWLSMPKAGATTIWESWEGTTAQNVESLDHYSKGAVCQWIFSRLCGLSVTGENSFSISPVVGGSLTHAGLKWKSPYGSVVSSWEIKDGKTHYHFEIPANTKAVITLPNLCGTVESGIYDFYDVEEKRR